MAETYYRQIELVLEARKADGLIPCVLSSEYPVDRYGFKEILDHTSPNSVNMARAKSGLPVLDSHDQKRLPVGKVENIHLDTGARKLRGYLRMGNSSRAKEIQADIDAKIIDGLSIGYVLEDKGKREGDAMRFMKWMPFECSLVAVGADPQAGINRNLNLGGSDKMENINDSADVRVSENKERQRVVEILAIGKKFKQDEAARKFVEEGSSIEEFRSYVLSKMGHAKPINNMDAGEPLGLSERELNKFSLVRALNAVCSGHWNEAPFEYEVSRAALKKAKRESEGLYLPFEVLGMQQRVVSKGGTGGNLVETTLMPGDFITLLRNKTAVFKLGAQQLTGLVGNVAIPKQSGSATGYWAAEDGAITESTPTFTQVTMSPKTLGGLVRATRKMLLQSSPEIENVLRADLAETLALAIDLAAINGSGASNQPTGILNTSGIGDVAIGANGGAPTWAHIIELENDVASANADEASCGYLTSPEIRGKLKQTQRFTSTDSPVWNLERIAEFESMNNYKAFASNQTPKTLVKGTSSDCHAIIFGDWRHLLVGFWGNGIELLSDPYSNFSDGSIWVRAMVDCDIAVRIAAAFSACKDARNV